MAKRAKAVPSEDENANNTYLKPGDVVTLTVTCNIPVDDYNKLKPSASLRRTVGDNPDEDISSMKLALGELVEQSLLIELTQERMHVRALAELGKAGLRKSLMSKYGEVTTTRGDQQ